MSGHTVFHRCKLLGFSRVNFAGSFGILVQFDDFGMGLLVIGLALRYAGINASFRASHLYDVGTL
jgi:hypothetical protein